MANPAKAGDAKLQGLTIPRLAASCTVAGKNAPVKSGPPLRRASAKKGKEVNNKNTKNKSKNKKNSKKIAVAMLLLLLLFAPKPPISSLSLLTQATTMQPLRAGSQAAETQISDAQEDLTAADENLAQAEENLEQLQ